MYNIKLLDGREIKNLELNGNNYISDVIINDEIFTNNLKSVEFEKDGIINKRENMKLIQNIVYNNKSWFILTEKTQEGIQAEENIPIQKAKLEIATLNLLTDLGVV